MPARPKGAAGCERRAVDRRAGPCASARMAPAPAARRWSRGDRSCSWAWWGWAAWAPTWCVRLMRAGHECVVYDVVPDAVDTRWPRRERPARRRGSRSSTSSRRPASIWLMVPAAVVDETLGRARAPPGGRRHRHRRRQLLLPRRPAPLEGARRTKGIHYVDAGTSGGVFGLERGYCLMVGGDDAAVARLATGPRDAGPRRRDDRAHRGSQRAPQPVRAGLAPLRSERRGPLREDGPQRHRVRDHGGLRRGAEHPEARRRRPAPARGRRRDDAAARPGALPVRARPQGDRRAVAARQRHLLLAARPHRPRPAGEPPARRLRGPGVGLGRGSVDLDRRHRRGRAGARS